MGEREGIVDRAKSQGRQQGLAFEKRRNTSLQFQKMENVLRWTAGNSKAFEVMSLVWVQRWVYGDGVSRPLKAFLPKWRISMHFLLFLSGGLGIINLSVLPGNPQPQAGSRCLGAVIFRLKLNQVCPDQKLLTIPFSLSLFTVLRLLDLELNGLSPPVLLFPMSSRQRS